MISYGKFRWQLSPEFHRYLQKEIETIKSRGYAIESDEYEYGLSSVGIPLFSKDNEFLGALGVAGLSARIDTQKLHEFGVSILRMSSQESLL